MIGYDKTKANFPVLAIFDQKCVILTFLKEDNTVWKSYLRVLMVLKICT